MDEDRKQLVESFEATIKSYEALDPEDRARPGIQIAMVSFMALYETLKRVYNLPSPEEVSNGN